MTSALTLPATASAAQVARQAVADLLAGHAGCHTDAAQLVATELVTNSVRHAAGGPDDVVELAMSLQDDCLHLEVSDRGPGFVPEFRRDYENGGGFGLYLVERLARRWGLTTNDKTTVWCDIACGAKPATA